MPELIINTNEVVINQEVKEDKNILLLEEINRKLDLILKEREEGHGETNY